MSHTVDIPRARSGDPSTSHAAANDMAESGWQAAHQRIVRNAIEQHPGCTTAELVEFCGLDRHQIARRTKEIEEAGGIQRGDSRPCRVKGRASITWWPDYGEQSYITDAYAAFLREKIKLAEQKGHDVADAEINPLLKHHQRDIVMWAVAGGCRAIFAAFGLGKSIMQLETLRLTLAKSGARRGLIVAPLGVRQEFRHDAEMLGQQITFVRRDSELAGDGLYITNYESIRDGRLDPNQFDVVSLDEASVLRSFGSKTYQTFLTLFEDVPYRFVATATPSPNRYKELIHYAGFLGIMDTGQALTRFFQRDSSKANNLTLYAHKEAEFWLWMSSWAIFLQKPSDLGYSDEGYDLPPLKVHYHEVQVDHGQAGHEPNGQGRMFQDAALGVSETATAKRDSLGARVAKLREILDADPESHYLLWHDLEDERKAIEAAVPSATSVYGAMDLDERERRVVGFSNGEHQYLTTKPILSGSGCNFQRHCHKAVFVGIGHKFNDFIQAIHRIYRFLQQHECEIHIIYSEAEREILRNLLAKWNQHDAMVDKMTAIIRKYGLSTTDMAGTLARTIGVTRHEEQGEHYVVANNDCVDETARLASDSIDLVVTSIPFANHYEYTPSYNDFGHTDDNDHFWQQMDHLTPELLRALKPGRLACVHVKDRILFGNVTGTGAPTVSPFHAECIFHMRKHGFDYMGMITVVTDVVRENNQTYRLGWSEQCKDGTKMGVGSPEYIILVRKPQTDRGKGYADERVAKDKAEYSRARWQTDAHAFWRSSGDRLLTAAELGQLGPDKLAKIFTAQSLAGVYNYADHVAIGEQLDARGALPSTFMSLAPGSHHPDVWHDVNRMRTLNGEQTNRNLQNHVCPLQLDIVDRLIERYSNPSETIYDPFAGLGTVPVRAIKKGRNGRGSELNADYFRDSLTYLDAAEREVSMPSLFDSLDDEPEVAHG